MTRRVRITLRCLREDLDQQLPPLEVDLADLQHPLLDEARRLAPNAPTGQKRILSIPHPLVYRLRHGRWRGATWTDEAAHRFWLLAAAQREAGSADDAFEVFNSLYDAGRLMPDHQDEVRDRAEFVARVLRAARDRVPAWIAYRWKPTDVEPPESSIPRGRLSGHLRLGTRLAISVAMRSDHPAARMDARDGRGSDASTDGAAQPD